MKPRQRMPGGGKIAIILSMALMLGVAGLVVTSTMTRSDVDCDRASVERWLNESDLEAWSTATRGSRLVVRLPDSQAELSVEMRKTLRDDCGREVLVEVAPPIRPL